MCFEKCRSMAIEQTMRTEQTDRINGDFNAVVSSLPQVLTFEEVMFCSLETLEFNCCSYDGFYFFIYKL